MYYREEAEEEAGKEEPTEKKIKPVTGKKLRVYPAILPLVYFSVKAAL